MKKFIIIFFIFMVLFFFAPIISSNLGPQLKQECLEHSTGLEVSETPYQYIKNYLLIINFNKTCKVIDNQQEIPSIPYK